MLSNGHAGFGGRSGETHQRKRRQGAPGRPNLAEGKTPKEALRCLKRRVSDAIYSHLQADARRATAAARMRGPGGQPGNDSVASAAGYTPHTGSSAKPLPSPAPPYDPRADTHLPVRQRLPRKPRKALDDKEASFGTS